MYLFFLNYEKFSLCAVSSCFLISISNLYSIIDKYEFHLILDSGIEFVHLCPQQ